MKTKILNNKIDKDLVKKRFTRCLDSYNANAGVQQEMAEKLVNALTNAKGDQFHNILEIGCGTGLLTKIISDKLNFKTLYANDLVAKTENYIKEISQNITFIGGDCEKQNSRQDLTS